MADAIVTLIGSHGYDGYTCPCGSAWFEAAITLEHTGTVTGHTLPVTCRDCGREHQV